MGEQHLQHFGLRFAVFEDGCGIGAGTQLGRLSVRFRRLDDVRHEAPLLQLDTLGLEVLLGLDLGALGLDFGHPFRRFTLLVELRRLEAQLVACVRDGDVGLRLGDLRDPHRLGLSLLGLRFVLSLGDLRRLEDLRGLGAADRGEISHVVRHVLNLQRVELQAEFLEVLVRFLQQLGRELHAVLVDFLRGHRGEHAAQVG